MLHIAIIGCGKIADQHVSAIARLDDCKIVSVCDRETLMSQQLAERHCIPSFYDDLELMFEKENIDVVHITTPPQSHYIIAKRCLENGCHVYIEKPFTVDADEALRLIEMAVSLGRLIVAGHNYQFTLEMQKMRALVEQNVLGGRPVHLESHWAYDLADSSYLGPVLGSRNHWVRQLPGQLLHNVLSHGVARLSEYLDEDLIDVVANGHQSDRLCKMGGQEVLDELRVLVRDKYGTTAFLCFSTQIKPGLNRLRVCGPEGSVIVDQSCGSIIFERSVRDKSYLTYFFPPLRKAWQCFWNASNNLVGFFRRRLYQDFGMRDLMDKFYYSIRVSGVPPIPYREILLTAKIMDQIFKQIYCRDEKIKSV